MILCQMDDRFYRLLLRIKTRTHRRVVDPSDALSSIIRMLPSTFCEHATEPPPTPPVSAKIYTMDEIVGRWPDVVQTIPTKTASDDATRNGGIIHLTEILNTNLKKNIALALSVCPVAVPNHPKRTCTACTVKHARKAARKAL